MGYPRKAHPSEREHVNGLSYTPIGHYSLEANTSTAAPIPLTPRETLPSTTTQRESAVPQDQDTEMVSHVIIEPRAPLDVPRRRRKRKPPPSPGASERKRRRFLDRNKVAAHNCRERKKMRVEDLEIQAKNLKEVRDGLGEELQELFHEVGWLKWMLGLCSDCKPTAAEDEFLVFAVTKAEVAAQSEIDSTWSMKWPASMGARE